VNDSCLIYLHVPKTAGTTMTSILRLRLKYLPSERLSFETLGGAPSDIEDIPFERRARARLVYGHVHYGIHQWIPRPSRYFTILRDPVRRVVSLYRYVLRDPNHPVNGALRESGMGLKEFVASGLDRTQTENGQVRQLAAVVDRDPVDGDLDVAISNLGDCEVVGLTERFDESVILMKRSFGWMIPYFQRRMVAPGAPSRDEPSGDAIEIIRDKNRLDLELYAEAERLFREQVATQTDTFGREVARFRRMNQVAGPTLHAGASAIRRTRAMVRSRRG
jgi:hypothetical protein